MARDFTGNNRVLALLHERRALKKIYSEAENAKQRWKEISDTLKELMGDERVATLPGWRLEIKTQNTKERIVPARTSKKLFVTWDDEEQE